ncbi:MAG: hypothetical protein HC893_10110 [Chloroflexaceae bacterium]|nr:hypothetical protein [Chloroflexaceae bacterium]
MRRFTPAGTLVVLAVLLLTLATFPHPPTSAQTSQRCFAETTYCIEGRIRQFWEQNGGLPVFGLPITPQREEMIEGDVIQVQWFERNRLELHPDNARPYDVLLGRLGVDALDRQGRNWLPSRAASHGRAAATSSRPGTMSAAIFWRCGNRMAST